MPLSFPFPLLPYLRFDLAELPVVLAFFLFGPVPSIVSAIIYWLILNLVGSFVPVGPAMKLFAVASMILGMWVGVKFYRRLIGLEKVGLLLALSILLGLVVRVVVMTFANFVVLALLQPNVYLPFAAATIKTTMGITFSKPVDALLLALILTGIFNGLHVFLSIIPTFVVIRRILHRGGLIIAEPWVSKILSRNESR